MMSSNGRRWMEAVDEWKLGGRRGSVPPGMGEPKPERNPRRRDYNNRYPNVWGLRPEVKKIPFFLSFFFYSNKAFFADLFFSIPIDYRVYVYHVEDYGGY